MLVYSPRQITLAAGERSNWCGSPCASRKNWLPANIARTCFLKKWRKTTAENNIENIGRAPASEELGVSLTALIGVSIPVIVRHGALDTRVKLAGLALGTIDARHAAARAAIRARRQ